MLVIKEFQFNPFSENTYVISDSETGECAIIDAGCYYADEQDILSGYIIDNNLKEQASMFGIQLQDPPIPIDHNVHENDIFKIGKYSLRAIHVPGHSPGSIIYYCKEEKIAFGGDVLFRGSIGRTDLPGGNYNQLITGIREKLFILPEDTVIYSGHGPSTTIGFEKKQNPYLQ